MATDRIRYVNRSSAGGDGTTNATAGANAAYTTIENALIAEYALVPDLVASDLRLIIECEGSGSDPDNILFSDFQFTTDDTRYVLIRVQGAHKHQGVYSTSHYRLVPSTVNSVLGITNIGCHVEIEGLQINMTGSLASNPIAIGFLNGNGHVRLRDCIIRASGAGTPSGSAAIYGTGIDARRLYMSNCLIYGPFFRGIQLNFLSGAGRGVVYYCTFEGLYRDGIQMTDAGSGRVFLRNNRVGAVVSPGQSFSLSGTTATSAANYTADAFSPQDATFEGKTFSYVDSANGDYHLAGNDGFVGSDLSADATLPVSTDVDGTARTLFFAGYDEFVVGGGGGGGTHPLYTRRRRR